ncbi:MAG TPA: hypothetical protein VLG68_10910, partial [Gammaproteobacteria bacterium]|nr:hypothetical protein [Gammaproteobacteria bacterium]
MFIISRDYAARARGTAIASGGLPSPVPAWEDARNPMGTSGFKTQSKGYSMNGEPASDIRFFSY